MKNIRYSPALLTKTSILPWMKTARSAISWSLSRGAVTSNSKISAPASLSACNFARDLARVVAITLSPRLSAAMVSSRPMPELQGDVSSADGVRKIGPEAIPTMYQ